MNDPNRLPTEEEIIERLLATRKKPKLIPKPSVAERAGARFNAAQKPTEAMAQDVALGSDALTQRIREERRQNGLFSPEEIARRQAALDRAVEATRGFQREVSYAALAIADL